MRRGELERRLVEFVNGMLPAADRVLPVQPDTALFEEGMINSLRILELIAFVEETTGTRVPDTEVRLANFRSVRAIAAAFGNGGGVVARMPGEGGTVIHVFERRRDRPGFIEPVAELTRLGELHLVPPGRFKLQGPARCLMRYFDSVARRWADDAGAKEERYPSLIPVQTLSRAGLPLDPGLRESVVPPAVCYHVYARREGARLDRAPPLLTSRGRCFRNETHVEPSLGRLRVFEMREIVALGSRTDVERFRLKMIDRARELVSDLGLEGRIETASDPFFLQAPEGPARTAADTLPQPRGRRLMQQVLPLKYELRLALDESGATCAVASFNHHLDFFGRRFDVRLASGACAHSGCVAFGLERWALAFLAQHGTDARAWPGPVRDFCAREVDHEDEA